MIKEPVQAASVSPTGIPPSTTTSQAVGNDLPNSTAKSSQSELARDVASDERLQHEFGSLRQTFLELQFTLQLRGSTLSNDDRILLTAVQTGGELPTNPAIADQLPLVDAVRLAAMRFVKSNQMSAMETPLSPPSSRGSMSDLVAYFQSLNRLCSSIKSSLEKTAEMPQIARRRVFHSRWTIAAVVLCGIAAVTLFMVRGVPSRPMPGGTIQFPNYDGKPLLPGQLAKLDPEIRWSTADSHDTRMHAVVFWQITSDQNPGRSVTGYLQQPTAKCLAESLRVHISSDLLPAKLSLGLGYPRTASSPAQQQLPSQCKVVRLGFPSVRGLIYPAGIPDRRDAQGKWYATAIREVDQALVSVFLDPSGKSWWYVDQGWVSVGQYLDRFLPHSEQWIGMSIADVQLPVQLRTLSAIDAGRSVDVFHKLDDLKSTLAKGPALYDPQPNPGQEWLRCYPPPYLRGFNSLRVDRNKLPGQTTDSLPVVGVCRCEAVAYGMWVNSKSSSQWGLGFPHFLKTTANPSGAAATGPAIEQGLWGIDCSSGKFTAFDAPAAASSIDPCDRRIDMSMRFSLQIPNEG